MIVEHAWAVVAKDLGDKLALVTAERDVLRAEHKNAEESSTYWYREAGKLKEENAALRATLEKKAGETEPGH